MTKGVRSRESERCTERSEALTRPANRPIVLDPADPMQWAEKLLTARFALGEDVTLRYYRGTFQVWDGARHADLPDPETRAAAWEFLHATRIRDGNGELKPFKPRGSSVDNLVDALRARAILPASVEQPAWLGAPPDGYPAARELIPCRNGLLHPDSGRLLAHTPRFFTPNALPYDFDPGAPQPVHWLGFMDDCFADDGESIESLQDAMGYSTGHDTSQQKGFMFIGPKRSGKGTIGRVWAALLGRHSVVTPTLGSLAERFGLAPLIGKRLALVSDARLGGRADQAAIVERILSVTGEDPVTADRKHIAAWIGRLPTLFVIMSNEVPRLGDASGAFASRFVTWELTQSFYGREDRGLSARLLTEMPGILNWALAGRRRLGARGHFVQPVTGEAIAVELAELSSPVGTFIGECCILDDAFVTPVRDLFDGWRLWCVRQGREHPGTAQTFGRDLRAAERSVRDVRPREEGGARVRAYQGVRLNQQWSSMVRDWSAIERTPEAPE